MAYQYFGVASEKEQRQTATTPQRRTKVNG